MRHRPLAYRLAVAFHRRADHPRLELDDLLQVARVSSWIAHGLTHGRLSNSRISQMIWRDLIDYARVTLRGEPQREPMRDHESRERPHWTDVDDQDEVSAILEQLTDKEYALAMSVMNRGRARPELWRDRPPNVADQRIRGVQPPSPAKGGKICALSRAIQRAARVSSAGLEGALKPPQASD